MILEVGASQKKGFHRQYFKQKHAYGWKAFDAHNFEVLECAHGVAAKNKFDSIVIMEGWHAENDLTQTYYDENKDQLQSAASLIKNLKDPEFHKNGTLEQLHMDFFS